MSLHTKIHANMKSVLLYGAETWRTTNTTTKKVQTFINNCLMRTYRWGWIGHRLQKAASTITRQALTWKPQGKRCPRNRWRRDLLTDTKKTGYSWRELKKWDRRLWKTVVNGLCPRRDNG